jgi:hypothetical protein
MDRRAPELGCEALDLPNRRPHGEDLRMSMPSPASALCRVIERAIHRLQIKSPNPRISVAAGGFLRPLLSLRPVQRLSYK